MWIAASILKTERCSLRHYTDATMLLAPLGNAQQYCSVFNIQLVFRRLFLHFAEKYPFSWEQRRLLTYSNGGNIASNVYVCWKRWKKQKVADWNHRILLYFESCTCVEPPYFKKNFFNPVKKFFLPIYWEILRSVFRYKKCQSFGKISELNMTDEKKKLDYRGKLILAPMVKVIFTFSKKLVKNCMPDHEWLKMRIRMLEYIIPDLQQTRLSLKVVKNVAEFCIYLAAAFTKFWMCRYVLSAPGVWSWPGTYKDISWLSDCYDDDALYFRAGSGLS